MFSRLKRQLKIFAPLGAGLLIITLLTALGGLWQYNYELDHQSVKGPTSPADTAALQKSTVAASTAALVKSGTSATAGPAQSAVVSSATGSNSIQAAPKADAAPTAASSPAGSAQPVAAASTSIALSLSVNGQAKGTVRLAAGSDQCDVLSQALAESVISSLDMRYSSQYSTDVIYVINGIGDPGTVWWTYTVNGSAPPYGCSYVTAHAGDSVNWQYIK